MARKKDDRKQGQPAGPVVTGRSYQDVSKPVRPFEGALTDLKKQLTKPPPPAPQPVAPPPQPVAPPPPPPPPPLSDEELLAQAMAGVVPVDKGPARIAPARTVAQPPKKVLQAPVVEDEGEPEPDWWAGDVDPALAWATSGHSLSSAGLGRRWQKKLDLHGLNAEAAKRALRAQLLASQQQKFLCLLVIHGKGLGSPDGPRLAGLVRQWLRSELKSHVIGYMQADVQDGGSGALYVFLRQKW